MGSIIKELFSQDIEMVLNLLREDCEFNGLIISDLEAEDIKPSFVNVYGEFEQLKLRAILLCFKEKIVYYSNEHRDVQIFIEIIKQKNTNKMNGKKDLIEKFKPFLEIEFESNSYISRMTSPKNKFRKNNVEIKKIQNLDDCYRLHNLYKRVNEYSFMVSDKDKFTKNQMKIIINGDTKTYYAEIKGDMVSTASIQAKGHKTAILAGVATPPQFRGNGYATKVVSELCNDVISEGKMVYLFYNNPTAGLIYNKIGFQEVGEWMVLGFK
ncbi:GNAT family N-acetyltransferase [Peribacillus deserti]|uniref:N-acetyltransferase domain-containing protein n=1 Tax=Peribacillus deserti TaxID=673318 RepID=A0A2N5M0C4_9BACI|nr:GNAT family N-acetyltransferase [Peribacillus deserti]PLT27812.1 hypothetical protein CUU66_21885 [Peribacillus deserti]